MRLYLLGFVLLLFASGPTLAASEYSFKAERQGRAVQLRARVLLRGELSTVWRVLTDYDAYSRFIPGMQQSKVVVRLGNTATVEQHGEVQLLWVKRPLHVLLSVVEEPMRSVESTLLSGSVKYFRGRYELSSVGDSVQLDYLGEVVPDDDDQVGLVELVAIRANSARQFEALVREIERVTAGEAVAAVTK